MSDFKEYAGLESVKLPERRLHLAVGMFDGLHRGHQTVIQAAIKAARKDGGLAGVLTFWPHPSAVLRPAAPTAMLMLPRPKARRLQALGVDVVITQQFTAEFAALEAAEFLPRLQKYLPGLVAIYVGENWRYGRGRLGDLAMLERDAKKLGLVVHGLPRVRDGDEPISSTRIRALLEDGDMEAVNELLGYAYAAEGKVVSGRGLGGKLGFPTLNLDWQPELEPRHGVYAVTVTSGDEAKRFPAVANYGVRPTVEANQPAVLEVHVLGACPFKRGDELTVEFRHFIRPEQKFPNLDALRAQIDRDRVSAQTWLAEN